MTNRKQQPLKLTFTPERLKAIIFKGMEAEGFSVEGDWDCVINIEETVARQGREQIHVPVYLITIIPEEEDTDDGI